MCPRARGQRAFCCVHPCDSRGSAGEMNGKQPTASAQHPCPCGYSAPRPGHGADSTMKPSGRPPSTELKPEDDRGQGIAGCGIAVKD